MACDPFSLCPRFDSVLPLVVYTKFSVTILVGIWSTMNIGVKRSESAASSEGIQQSQRIQTGMDSFTSIEG